MTEPRVWTNRFAGAGPPGGEPARDVCQCVGRSAATRPDSVAFHPERQDTGSPGWQHLLALIDEAAADGRPVFQPLVDLSAAERRQIITLPPSMATLTEVRHLVLYASNLVRIPPEIGAMSSLEMFEPYTSHRLHWFPYEITRCTRLRGSTVSTRALYGNFKFRPPFPDLRATTGTGLDPEAVRTCSVCDGPIEEPHQVWISRLVGTDVLPLLVNACSAACVAALPAPQDGYVPAPHTGGPDLVQPSGRR